MTCADIGASMPSSPAKRESASAAASVISSRRRRERAGLDLAMHRRAWQIPIAAWRAEGCAARFRHGLGHDLRKAGGAQVGLDPRQIVIANGGSSEELGRIVGEEVRQQLGNAAADRIVIEAVPDVEQEPAVRGQNAARLR
jgi:hypothetical protein